MILLFCAALLGAAPPDWMYPDAEIISKASGLFRRGFVDDESYAITATTGDDFGTVAKFFEKKAGTVIDASHGRPVAIKILTQRWKDAAIIVVVSRAEGERKTHFALSYRSGGRRGNPPESFDWTYPRAKAVAGGRMTTDDEYAAVVKYYQQKAGAIQKDRTRLENGSITVDDIDVDALEVPRDRPVALKVVTRWWQGATATAVISRAKDENETHIDLIYRKDQP
jgi:hypothetical protein